MQEHDGERAPEAPSDTVIYAVGPEIVQSPTLAMQISVYQRRAIGVRANRRAYDGIASGGSVRVSPLSRWRFAGRVNGDVGELASR